MKMIFTALDRFSDFLKIIGAIALTGMMLLTVVDVIGRFFNRPIFGSVELVGFLATIVVAAALPYTIRSTVMWGWKYWFGSCLKRPKSGSTFSQEA